MMKLQEVLLKAMAKKITWWSAAEIIGVSDRTMRRWRERLEEHGYSGLADRRKGRPSDKRVPLAMAEEVLRLYQETYYDLNMRHFHEKLREQHGIQLSYTWVQKALQGAGLVAKRGRRAKHRRRREPRPLPGMLLHIDGSKHQWFSDERWYDLIVILDDATKEIYYAQLVEEESTRTVMAGLRHVIESKGLFCALYSDRGSHFFVTPKAGGKVDKGRLTQVGRAMKELGVQMIAAYSPQARGRSERSFGTWQGRLPQELRLAGITTAERANEFLAERYIGEFNEKFTVEAKETGTAFRKTTRADLNWVFTVQTERVVDRDNTVAIGDQSWQLEKSRFRHSLAKSTVTIHEHLDGTVSIRFGPHVVGRYTAEGARLRDTRQSRKEDCGKGGPEEAEENREAVSHGSHRPLEIPPSRDSHFPTAPTTTRKVRPKTRKPPSASRKGSSGAVN
ncbi:ISNCY family transposase [uncultured Paludibaculum sp.]|uniref:ISNCY family transposase n=1 Tax=uncultured Paludibaculum sp. TaxID=1765020 RepID=UPI002AAAF839|nr:ISNCY family transposase [uncultured Paludibaculum sp.]